MKMIEIRTVSLSNFRKKIKYQGAAGVFYHFPLAVPFLGGFSEKNKS
jgi:hypothetical protein